MPLLLIVLVAVIIAQVGFWDTIGVMFGALAAVLLFIVLLIAAIAVGGYMLLRRFRWRRN